MKWVETIERWWGTQGSATPSLKIENLEGLRPARIIKICSDLGEGTEVGTVEMLLEKGFSDEEIEEMIVCANILNCQVRGDLEFQVERVMSEEFLIKHGYRDVEQFNSELKEFLSRYRTQH